MCIRDRYIGPKTDAGITIRSGSESVNQYGWRTYINSTNLCFAHDSTTAHVYDQIYIDLKGHHSESSRAIHLNENVEIKKDVLMEADKKIQWVDDGQYITGDATGMKMRCDQTLLVDSSDVQNEWDAQLESVKFNATLFEIYGRNPEGSPAQAGPNLQLRSTYGGGAGARYCTFTMSTYKHTESQEVM